MADRCKPGDVAIIIRDVTGCEANLGRAMHVCGPRRVHPGRGTVWWIKPVNGNRITYLDVASNKIKRGRANGIDHEDDWLLPIRPEAESEEVDAAHGLPAPTELEAA